MHLYSWKFNKTKIKYIFWFLNTRTYIGQLHTSHHLMFHSLRRCTETKEVCWSRLVLRFPVHSLLLHHLPGGEIHPRNPRHRNQRHSLLLPDALHCASSNLPQVSASEQCSCTLVHSNSSEFSIDCEIFFLFVPCCFFMSASAETVSVWIYFKDYSAFSYPARDLVHAATDIEQFI